MQEIVVFAVVFTAFIYIVRRAWLSLRGDKSCGSCDGCASNKQPKEPQLVQIDLNGSFRK